MDKFIIPGTVRESFTAKHIYQVERATRPNKKKKKEDSNIEKFAFYNLRYRIIISHGSNSCLLQIYYRMKTKCTFHYFPNSTKMTFFLAAACRGGTCKEKENFKQ